MNDILDILQVYLMNGFYIGYDGLWHLYARDGDSVAQGATLRGMVCQLPDLDQAEWYASSLEQAASTFAESAMKVANALYHEKV